jgi:hypothetical protein
MHWRPLSLVLSTFALGAAPPPPDSPPSFIAAPVRVNLAQWYAAAERATPRVPPGVETWINLPGPALGGATYRFDLYRDPLQFALAGNRLEVDTTVNYWLQVGLRMKGWVKGVAGCGMAPESYRRVRLGLAAELGLTPDWGLDLKLTPVEPVKLDACQVTALGYDITGVVLAGMKDALLKATQSMEQQVRGSGLLRQKVENAWLQAQQPMELSPGVHLLLNPEQVRLAPLRSEGDDLIITPEIRVRPTLTLSEAQPAPYRPLPPLDLAPAPIQPGFQLRVEADLGYAEATAQLTRQMVGSIFTTDKGSFQVTSVAVGSRADAMLLAVGLKGRVDGTLTLTGHPRFDPASGTIRLEDLDYTLESKSWISRLGVWLYHSSLRQTLADKCNFFLDQSFQNLRAQAQQGLNRDLGPGLAMSGVLDGFTLDQIQVLGDHLGVVAQLGGQLQIAVRPGN